MKKHMKKVTVLEMCIETVSVKGKNTPTTMKERKRKKKVTKM